MNNVFAFAVISLFGWMIISTAFLNEEKETTIEPTEATSNSSDFIFERSLERNGVDSATLELNISAGELLLSGGSSRLLDTYITYSREELKPEYEVADFNSGHPHISIKHQRNYLNSSFNWDRGDNNKWDLKLSSAVRYDLDINAGAGKCDLDLADTNIGSLSLSTGASSANINLRNSSVADIDIKTGVGSIDLDLSGERQNDLYVDISGGVGSVTVKVPSDYGVRFRATGLGSISADGFYRDGRYYQNDSYGETDYSIDIDIAGGIGSVEVVQM